MTEQLSDWTHNVTDIPAGGLDREREASEGERAAIADDLKLLKLNRLATCYRIKSLGDGSYRLSGKITAKVEQACIVSLDPVADEIDAPVAPDVGDAQYGHQDLVGEHAHIEPGHAIFGRQPVRLEHEPVP